MGLRGWVYWYNNGGGRAAVITHSWVMSDTTVIRSGSGDRIWVQCFSLHSGNRVYDVFLQYHSCKISRYLWVTSRIHLYQAIQVIFSVTLKFLPGTVTEPQIGAVFYIIGRPPPLVNCFDRPSRNWLLSPIEAFEDTPSFKTKKM